MKEKTYQPSSIDYDANMKENVCTFFLINIHKNCKPKRSGFWKLWRLIKKERLIQKKITVEGDGRFIILRRKIDVALGIGRTHFYMIVVWIQPEMWTHLWLTFGNGGICNEWNQVGVDYWCVFFSLRQKTWAIRFDPILIASKLNAYNQSCWCLWIYSNRISSAVHIK